MFFTDFTHNMSPTRTAFQILLLTFVAFTVSDGYALRIYADKGTTISIRSTSVRGCTVCTKQTTSKQRCGLPLPVKITASASVVFLCPRPQDVFKVEIVRNVECTTESCNGHITHTDSSFSPLQEFNRTFTWNLKASQAFKIDFTKTGLRQIHPLEICPDRHSYTLQASQSTGNVTIGKYCRGGLISSAQILNHGSFSLDVPAGQKLQSGQFVVSVGEEIKSFAKITLTFPKGNLSTELFSPNYPDSFPNDDIMEWYFEVPDKHKTSVQVLNLTQPHCYKKTIEVEYDSKGREVKSLTDDQPEIWGNVSLKLKNCNMDLKRSGSSGLSVTFKVSTSSTRLPAMLTIILIVVTAVLTILVTGLFVACMVTRKNKNRKHPTPVNNPKCSTSVLPGDSGPPNTDTNEYSVYHEYTTIDDTLVYSHLLQDDDLYTAGQGLTSQRPQTLTTCRSPFSNSTASRQTLKPAAGGQRD